MKTCLRIFMLALGLGSSAACDSSDDSNKPTADAALATDAEVAADAADSSDAGASDAEPPSSMAVLDLDDVKTNPTDYEWFDFRPNVQKLILAGAAETEHIAILWYTTTNGGVGLHYHSKTESVYVVDGTQTDGKGIYPTGALYFNPPGSGHQITDSSGFFLLAYAAPPDFMNTALIGEYTPVRIDTTSDDFSSMYAFEKKKDGVRVFATPLAGEGGMSAEFIELASAKQYDYTGNYVLVLQGTCEIEGTEYGKNMLVVTKTVDPEPYDLAAPKGDSCLALGVSF
jgi:hypothetical protein